MSPRSTRCRKNDAPASTNGALLSSNEELHSTNEEPETAKEELQSGNEELTTVNEELHKRNFRFSEGSSDFDFPAERGRRLRGAWKGALKKRTGRRIRSCFPPSCRSCSFAGDWVLFLGGPEQIDEARRLLTG